MKTLSFPFEQSCIGLLLASFFSLSSLTVSSQTGPNFAGSVTNVSGQGSLVWQAPVNASGTSDNVSWASTPLMAANDESQYLVATNFGFSIPNFHDIDGIEVSMEAYRTDGNLRDISVYLVVGGIIQTTGNRATGGNLPLGPPDGVLSYGSPVDLWEQPLTKSDVENAGFGVAIRVKRQGGGGGSAPVQALMDRISIKVYHSLVSVDNDPTNEFNMSVGLTGTILEINDAGGAVMQDLGSLTDQVEADVAQNASDISANATSITNNIASISALQANVSQNAADIAADDDGDSGNELNASLVLNGSDLELTDPGGTLSVDLSSLGGGGSSDAIADADDDTKVQVEESPDEDVIRFDIAGTEQWVMTGNRLEAHNTGQSIFIGFEAGYSDDLSDNRNVMIGFQAGESNTSGEENVFIGFEAGLANTNGSQNSFVGQRAGASTTSGSGNTFLGYEAGQDNTVGTGNTFLGSLSGEANTTGFNNTFSGYNAGLRNTVGLANTFTGNAAGAYNTSGVNNVFSGSLAGGLNDAGNSNTLIGYRAGYSNVTGHNNTSLGFSAGHNNVGSNNVFIGHRAGYFETGNDKLYIDNSNTATPLIHGDFSSDELTIYGTLNIDGAYAFPTADGTNNQVMTTDGAGNASWATINVDDADADPSNELNSGAVLIGNDLEITDAGGTLTVDLSSLSSGTPDAIADADDDTKVQVEESPDEDMIRFDIAGTEQWIMTSSRLEALNTGSSVFIGEGAGANDDLTTNQNVFLGYQSGTTNSSGQQNTFVGHQAGSANTTGHRNTYLGDQSGYQGTVGTDNTFVGTGSGYSNTTGSLNTFLGKNAGFSNATGAQNSFVGERAGYSNTSGNNNAFVGHNTGYSNTSGYWNAFTGMNAGYSNTGGFGNTYSGMAAGYANQSGYNNTALGYLAGFNALGDGNVFLGANAGYSETGANKLYIDNSNTITPLIYGDFSTDELTINGTLNVNGAYTMPSTDGSAGQVMATDGSGNVAWGNLNVNDADSDPSNELNSTAVLNGSDLEITDAGGTLTVDLSSLSSGTPDAVADADNDTKIQVEESVDEDVIRFDVAGTERWVMDGPRLEAVNSGLSLFIGEGAGSNDDLSNNQNVFIGNQAGLSNTTGANNTYTGDEAGKNNTTGGANVAYGSEALRQNTTGNQNSGLGFGAGAFNQSGNRNVSIGYASAQENTSGNDNVAIGRFADIRNLGDQNVTIGTNAGAGPTGGTHSKTGSVMIGYYAGSEETNSNRLYIENSNSTTPLIYGEFDTDLVRINGTLDVNNAYALPTVDGASSEVLTTDGAGNVSWQPASAGSNDWTVAGNDIYSSLPGNVGIGTSSPSSKLEVVGEIIAAGLNTPGHAINTDPYLASNTLLGEGAGENATGLSSSTAVGKNSLRDNAGGTGNTAIGFGSMKSNGTGSQNTALGSFTLEDNTTGWFNVAVGLGALRNNTSGERNIAVGYSALRENTTGSYNVSTGFQTMVANISGGSNSAYGYFSLVSNTTGNQNSAYGHNSLLENTAGNFNSAMGYRAGQNNTIGSSNIALGSNALFTNAVGNNNTAVGNSAGFNALGSGNVFVGFNSGYNETGDNQLYIDNSSTNEPLIHGDFSTDELTIYGTLNIDGAYAFPTADGTNGQVLSTDGAGNVSWQAAAAASNEWTTAGNDIYSSLAGNVGIGVTAPSTKLDVDGVITSTGLTTSGYALSTDAANTTNVRLGMGAAEFNTESNIVAIGDNALAVNAAAGNTGVGSGALRFNTTGLKNTAVGVIALRDNTTGIFNTALGANAMQSNTTGVRNVAVGNASLYTNSDGNYNAAVGYEALYLNSSGEGNTATGYGTMRANTTGTYNTASGFGAMFYNTTGSDNVAFGMNALLNNTTASQNVAVGKGALLINATGTQNTAVGHNAGSTNANYNNATAVGYNTQNTGHNQVHLGNASVSTISGQVTMTTYSDARVKDNVSEDVVGLEFINRLRPVVYNFNVDRENSILGISDPSDAASKYAIEGIRFSGFLAQEVEEAARDVNYEFSGVRAPENEQALYKLSYSEFVVPLVKAVQEQQLLIEENAEAIQGRDAIIADLVREHQDILERLEQLELNLAQGKTDGISTSDNAEPTPNMELFQNVPNPFAVTTRIVYSTSRPGHTRLSIYNESGLEIDTVIDQYQEAGEYTIEWDGSGHASGVYIYSLRLDGEEVFKKMMILH